MPGLGTCSIKVANRTSSPEGRGTPRSSFQQIQKSHGSELTAEITISSKTAQVKEQSPMMGLFSLLIKGVLTVLLWTEVVWWQYLPRLLAESFWVLLAEVGRHYPDLRTYL